MTLQIRTASGTIHTVDDWFTHAAPKGKEAHWQPGRSAMESARAWCPDTGPCVPVEIQALLDSHPDLTGARVTTAYPEHRVRFDTLRGEPRNTDVAAIAEHPAGRIAISVEAKADESFDRPVSQVLASVDARLEAGERSGGRTRVESLGAALLPPGTRADDLRYQLLTATAGALAFAHDQGATRAVLIIHEFVSSRTDDRRRAANRDDLDQFVAALSGGRLERVPTGSMLGPIEVPGAPRFGAGISLYVGKAARDLRA